MSDYEKVLNLLLDTLHQSKGTDTPQFNIGGPSQVSSQAIPLGISNRHAHLAQKDIDILFGPGTQLSSVKELAQPGQFACKETITLVGPKGAIEKVRVLGPSRSESQVELLTGDCFKLGIPAEVRMSGDLDGSPGLTLVGPKGTVVLHKGAIVAQRHIHMHTADALAMGLSDGQVVKIALDTPRGGIYNNVVVRANDSMALECHLDIEEGNAMQANSKTTVRIIK